MAAQISIVLKAVDRYSSALTGLNQGFELVGKAIGAVKFAADAAFGVLNTGLEIGSTIVELGRLGGAFQEQRNQFENLANSYNVDGQKIIDTVKRTSANTLTEFDSIAVATRGLAAGFQGEELDTALSYIKRWTESTGESFESAAERVFMSLSSGRYSVLRQMGLVIENGASFEEVTVAMGAALERFGDTGFNASDKLDALDASTSDFRREIGQAVNESELFKDVLGTLSDSVVSLVRGFDRKPITAFIDGLYLDFLELANSLKYLIPNALEDWNVAFSSIEDESIDATTTVRLAFIALAQTWNDLIDSISENKVLGTVFDVFLISLQISIDLLKGTIGLLAEIFDGIVEFIDGVDTLIGKAFAGIAGIEGAIASLASSVVGFLADMISKIFDESTGMQRKLLETIGIEGIVERLKKGSEQVAGFAEASFTDMNRRLGMKGSEQLGIVGDIANGVSNLLSDTSSKFKNSLKFDVNSMRISAKANIEATKNAAVNASANVAESGNRILGSVQSVAIGTKNIISTAFRGIGQLTAGIILPDITSLQREALRYAAEMRDRIKGSGDQSGQDTRPEWQDAIDGPKEPSRAEQLLADADWPSEFRAMGEFFFDIILSIAEDAPLPYAITTRGTGL